MTGLEKVYGHGMKSVKVGILMHMIGQLGFWCNVMIK